ncbi:hypothetical protein [Bradyrhizobium sp. ARR65]|uniref:hypothetical protein n=1 Tax=Bradyrhizobium sp. ARR65 TaxID=1040989 RepID=UPI00054E1C5A|nr:hypothetical protein [Bradyrhizobium sp. ARR65]
MKCMMAVAAILAMLALPAQAQMGGGGGRRHQGNDSGSEPKKPQVDEKAYKAALDRIPDPKGKYDPWGMTRPASSDKK